MVNMFAECGFCDWLFCMMIVMSLAGCWLLMLFLIDKRSYDF